MRQYYSIEFYIETTEDEAQAAKRLSETELNEVLREQRDELRKHLISDAVPGTSFVFTKIDNTRLEGLE